MKQESPPLVGGVLQPCGETEITRPCEGRSLGSTPNGDIFGD
jgi:hypothetical protein